MSQDMVRVNVGGTLYTTTISTLTRESNSMLGRMFSSKWQPEQREPVFIDADGTHFKYILNYLRRGSEVFLPNDLDILDELLVEANYFHLEGLIHLISEKLSHLRPPQPLVPANVLVPGPNEWMPAVGDAVRWRPDAIEGYWRSVSVAVASFHYQMHQDVEQAVCGFMHKTKFLPDDMEVFFLRCVSCRASTRVAEVWRYDLDSLKSIKAVMPTLSMRVAAAPAVINHIISSDCLSVHWSSSMILHVSKSALMPAI